MKRLICMAASAFFIAACAGSTATEQPILDLTEISRIVVQTLEAETTAAAAVAETEEVSPPPTNIPRPSSTPRPTDKPTLSNLPQEIATLEGKGYEFHWEGDHWESRNLHRGSVFFFYPNGVSDGITAYDPGFGYTSSFNYDSHSINLARRDFFSAFGLDPMDDIWMLQLGEAILSDGEDGGKSCRGNLCCVFFMPEYPEYRFYCTLN